MIVSSVKIAKLFSLACLIISVWLVLGASQPVFANQTFETAYQINCRVLPSGVTLVTQNISLTNKFSDVYATNYSLKLEADEVENVKAFDSLGPLNISQKQSGSETVIELEFNRQAVGKNETLEFDLSYEVRGWAKKSGQVWEVVLPKLIQTEEVEKIDLNLTVPKSFGQLAFISPQPVNQQSETRTNVYSFNQDQLRKSSITAAFGEFQVYNFLLNYHLNNPNLITAKMEIALPPDTAYQQIIYEEINPPPLNVEVDQDGNWLASYFLDGNEKLNITAQGKAKVYSQPVMSLYHDFFQPDLETLKNNLEPDEFWQSEDMAIIYRAKELKTPEAIYRFVVETLEYDYDLVKNEAQRQGALAVLKASDRATCMEFTDLFIAIARAAGVPAREMNGYAHTTNPKLKPLSLVADLLHSWPEYYDENKKIWVPVDPTWEKTTQGVDYFNKFDHHHFAFVIHGQDSQWPYPAGSYKSGQSLTKDVQVTFGQYETESQPLLQATLDIPSSVYSELGGKGKLIIENQGGTAVYQLPVELKAAGLNLDSNFSPEIAVIPAFGKTTLPIKIKPSPLVFGTKKISVLLEGEQFNREIRLKSLILEIILPIILIVVALTFTAWRVKNKQTKK